MTSRLLIFSLLILSAFCLAACGGGGAGNEDARLVEQYGLSLDVLEAGGADYALAVQETETILVDVRVENAIDMTRSYIELNYDSELITPLRVMDGGFLGADILFLQVTDRPHRVPVAVARTGENPEGVSGRGVIARVEFARGAYPGRDTASTPGQALYTGFDVDQGADTITVHWTDDNSGDTNTDQYLNGMDLFPIATKFGLSTGDGNYDACADSNSDGTINGMDVFPLAAKFDQRFDGYNVFWDLTPDMGQAFLPENPTPIAVDYQGTCRGDYEFTVGPLLDDNEYFIGIVTLDDDAGAESDFCVSDPQVLGTPNYFKPATDLWGENYGDYIFLDWEKPQTSERVLGYHVYRAPESGGPAVDISGKTSATQYEDHGIEDLETDNYLYHVIVEYGDQDSEPSPIVSVYWEKTNLPPIIYEVTTTNLTMGRTDVLDATLTVDGDDGEGGDDITWTWEIIEGSGTFDGGDTGETVTVEHSASTTPEAVVVQVTGDDGAYQVSDTIRLTYVANYPRIKIGVSGPSDGHFVDYTMEDMKNGGNKNFADDIFSQKMVLLMNFWATW